MSISLKNLCFELWKTNHERQGLKSEFHPILIKYIGVDNINEYDNVIATLYDKASHDASHSIIFDSKIDLEFNFDLLNNIKSELGQMDVHHLGSQDITLFQDSHINTLFLKALEYTVNLSMKQETFMNDSVRNNFICKMILYAYTYLFDLDFSNQDCCALKCIYYGSITRQDVYFLIMLAKMNFDVVYINPLKDDWENVDTDQLYEICKNKQILSIDHLHSRAERGTVISENKSMTLQFEQQIEEELFQNTGVFKPWQFRTGNTKSIFFNASIIDLQTNFNEEARFRNGFNVEHRIVSVPHFFFEIEGEYSDIYQYKELVDKCCIDSPTSLFINGSGSDIYNTELLGTDKYQLMFCQRNDGTFDIEEIKKLPFYKYSSYNDNTENFILNKINETLLNPSIFQNVSLNPNEMIDFCALILNLNKKIIRIIDNFDFPHNIPKIVVFLDKETQLDKLFCKILCYLSIVGFDIIIFTPAGMSNLSSYVNPSYYNNVRLDTINYERTYVSIQLIKHKKGFGVFKLFN